MNVYHVSCSDSTFLNEDIAEEQKKGWEPVSISCTRRGTSHIHEDITCCVLFKKRTIEGEEWLPEIRKKKVWKK